MRYKHNALLASVAAAALVLGAGLASAQQGANEKGGPERAAAASQKQHSDQSMSGGDRHTTTGSTTSGSRHGEADRSQQSQKQIEEPHDSASAGSSHNRNSTNNARKTHETADKQGHNQEAAKTSNRETSKAGENTNSHANHAAPSTNAASSTHEKNKSRAEQNGSTAKQNQNGRISAQRRGENAIPKHLQSNASVPMQGAEGRRGHGRAQEVSLSSEQEKRVQQTLLSRGNVPRAGNVNFAIHVGTEVPASVHVVQVPESIVKIHPGWRDYEYFVAEDDIVIVDRSHKIVATIPTGSPSRASFSTESSSSRNLDGTNIRDIQTVLIRKGFLNGRADGIFGPKTRSALVEFQKKNGMEATGRIDEQTISSLGLAERQGKSNTNQSNAGKATNGNLGGQTDGKQTNLQRERGAQEGSKNQGNRGNNGQEAGSNPQSSGSSIRENSGGHQSSAAKQKASQERISPDQNTSNK